MYRKALDLKINILRRAEKFFPLILLGAKRDDSAKIFSSCMEDGD
jgi:hypothetical protein